MHITTGKYELWVVTPWASCQYWYMVYQQSGLNCNPQFQFVITDVPITVNKEKYHIYRLEWHLLAVTTHVQYVLQHLQLPVTAIPRRMLRSSSGWRRTLPLFRQHSRRYRPTTRTRYNYLPDASIPLHGCSQLKYKSDQYMFLYHAPVIGHRYTVMSGLWNVVLLKRSPYTAINFWHSPCFTEGLRNTVFDPRREWVGC